MKKFGSFAVTLGLSLSFVISTFNQGTARAYSSDSSNELGGTITTKVVGGNTLSISQAPWQVALIDKSANANFLGQFCGGSIISREWIVTAAHCVDSPKTVSDFLVLSGESELSNSFPVSGSTVKKIVINPNWNSITDENDIALVQLATPLNLIPGRIETIRIPNVIPTVGGDAQISGWG